MDALLSLIAVCIAAYAIYTALLRWLDGLLSHRSAVRLWARECCVAVTIVATLIPLLVRVARSYAAAERRIRAEGAR